MKNVLVVLKKFAPFALLMIGLPAAGAGGAGTQGPRFLGAGLDEPIVLGGVYSAGSVASFKLSGASFSMLSASSLSWTGGTPQFTLRKLKCQTPSAENPLLTVCTAFVDTTPSGPVCKIKKPSTTPVPLLAINAKWNSTNAELDFSPPNDDFVIACLDQHPTDSDLDDSIGAIGKCVGKSFFLKASMTRLLHSCIRALRADYCGNGLSLTRMGTPLAIYDLSGSPSSGVVCRPKECFEASWNEQGANCISHARYEHLVLLSTSANLHEKGADAGVPAERPTTVIDGLTVCGKTYEPLASCVAQYTDFWYDDGHQISGAGPFNPVDAVTAQYVCRHGKKRKDGPVRTRTMVYFVPTGGGTAEPLACCDTLGCK